MLFILNKYTFRCGKHQCDIWQPHAQHNLIALWTVKKIRHRDNHGHKYELEYIISPVHREAPTGYMTKQGRFDYAIPGHIFVVKTQSYAPPSNNIATGYKHQASEQQSNVYHHNHHVLPNDYPKTAAKPSVVVGYGPKGHKHIHHFPDYFTPYPNYHQPAKYPTITLPSTTDPKEIELYKQLIDSLASKTSTSHGPHRFDLTGVIPQLPVKHTIPTVTTHPSKPIYHPETTVIPSQPTLVQLPTGQIVPVEEVATTLVHHPQTDSHNYITTLPHIPPTITTSQHVPITSQFPTSHSPIPVQPTHPTQPVHFVSSEPHVTYSQPDEYLNTKPPVQTTYVIPETKPQTKPVTIHYYTPASEENETTPKKVTTSTSYSTSTQRPPTTYATTETFKTSTVKDQHLHTEYEDFVTNLFPETSSHPKQTDRTTTRVVSTTERYNDDTDFETSLFPETTKEHTKTTQETSQFDPSKTTMYIPSKTTKITSLKPTDSISTVTSTSVKTTVTNDDISSEEEADLFPTEPLKPVTQAPAKKPYPGSINEQLPPPDKDTDTTIPYVSSTVTQKTVAQAEETKNTESKVTTSLLESTSEVTPVEATTTKTTEPTSVHTVSTVTSTVQQTDTLGLPSSQSIPSTEATVSIEVTTEGIHTEDESTTNLSTTRYYLPPKVEYTYPTTYKESTATTAETQKETTHEAYTTKYTTRIPESTTNELTTGPVHYTTPDVHTNIYDSTTYQSHESTPVATPEYIITQINSDGTVKTTSFPFTTLTYLGTTSEGVTYPIETTRPPFKTTKPHPTSTTQNDFLVDQNTHKINTVYKSNSDISEDDIFGSTKLVTKPSKGTTKEYVQSELSKDLFGSDKSAKLYRLETIYTTNQPTTQETPKIIFSNFYQAATTPMTPYYEDYEGTYGTTVLHVQPTRDYETTHDFSPLTSQSYSTSISFEVNKRNHTQDVTENTIQYEPTIKANISEIDSGSEYRIYKAELTTAQTTPQSSTTDVKAEFDTIALQLVNHARSISLLSEKTKSPKYKRRFIPKRKRGERRKR